MAGFEPNDPTSTAPFRRQPWDCGPLFWDSPFALPRFVYGQLASFGHEASNLLHAGFGSRLQVAVQADRKTSVRACLHQGADATRSSKRSSSSGSSDSFFHRAAADIELAEGPVRFAAGLFTGEPGSLRGSAVATLSESLGLCAFVAGSSLLEDLPSDERHEVRVGAALEQPLLTAHAYAAFSAADSHPQAVAGRCILALGPLRLGAEATVPFGLLQSERDNLSSSSASPAALARVAKGSVDVNLRAVYSGTSRSVFSAQPESFQAALSLENSGRRLVGSYYHHTACRVNQLPRPYWQSLAFGGEYVHQIADGASQNALAVAALWQLSEGVLVKARLDTGGNIDSLLAVKSAKLHDALPPIGLNLCGGFNLRSQRLRFGLTLSIGEDMTRAGPRTDASVFY